MALITCDLSQVLESATRIMRWEIADGTWEIAGTVTSGVICTQASKVTSETECARLSATVSSAPSTGETA